MGEEELIKGTEELENEGFSVIEEVDVGDMEDVKEQRTLLPPTRGVKLQIAKAQVTMNKDKTYRSINLDLILVDGLEEGKYRGMHVFTRVCYYADPSIYTKDFFKNKQHLVQLKYLKNSVELTDPNKVNDTFVTELKGQFLTANIVQVKGKPYQNAEGQTVTPDITNEARNFKKLELTEAV